MQLPKIGINFDNYQKCGDTHAGRVYLLRPQFGAAGGIKHERKIPN